MKKLRMIVTSIVVLAIVGSAFAFRAKKAEFCLTTNLTSADCTTYTTGTTLKIITSGIQQYRIFKSWDGDGVACTTPNNHNCGSTNYLGID